MDDDSEITKKICQLSSSQELGIALTQLYTNLKVPQDKLNNALQKLIANNFITILSVNNIDYVKYQDPEDRNKLENKKALLCDNNCIKVYEAIYWAKSKGIETKDIRTKCDIQGNQLVRILKKLIELNMIKAVKKNSNKSRNLYIIAELEPEQFQQQKIWHKDGQINKLFLENLKIQIIKHFGLTHIQTLEELVTFISAFSDKKCIDNDEINSLIQYLIYDNIVEELISNPGSPPTYKLSNWDKVNSSWLNFPSLTKIPCGQCALINECQAIGKISPMNCTYINQFLSQDIEDMNA